jgi:hypothetical protein
MLAFFEWLEALGLGKGEYTNAFMNVAHLLSLTVFIGAMLVVDLRLIGSGMRRQPIGELTRNAQPWLLGGFVAMVLTGASQVAATPMKAYFSDQFWLKMQLLIVGVIFTAVVRTLIANRDEAPAWGKFAGVASIALWSYIAVQGRLIGLLQ